ncbi:hypothetical protein K438DRAFT_1764548 [Mycena galopus ATCC 62051]|nr:hypothetical protein K438DRAFT_1764548 [Mycena galopus ATCC 62051]
MKSLREKARARFSPFPVSPPHPKLSHPRKASRTTIETGKTSNLCSIGITARDSTRLFASDAANGHGALSSQVTETQFFGQFGINVSRLRSTTPSPRKQDCLGTIINVVCSPSSFSAAGSANEAIEYELEEQSQPLEEFPDPNDISLVDDWSDHEEYYLGDHKLDLDGYPIGDSSPYPAVYIPVEVEVKVEPESLCVSSSFSLLRGLVKQESGADLTHKSFDLNPFEQWLIERVREGRKC